MMGRALCVGVGLLLNFFIEPYLGLVDKMKGFLLYFVLSLAIATTITGRTFLKPVDFQPLRGLQQTPIKNCSKLKSMAIVTIIINTANKQQSQVVYSLLQN